MEQPDWNTLSPARMWRDWIAKSEAQWSEAVSQMLKNEHTGEAMNRQLNEMQLLHRQFSELAQASLATANLPSRNDFEALDERMGRLEDGLAQVAAELSRLVQALAVSGGNANADQIVNTSRPTRNRKPASDLIQTRG
ncbi:hypothetical protein [Limnohabitans sp. Hippo4]|uniref:hypothetical protein n=1 Tax=Limnohabitans sp. Hippo4 TaxID=1826167 RepID=UPI000D3757E5|nr:hypothetical protein [Limnohabitans sp. Hippo4]PUE36758.1 hypothetical protein B9Z46_08775 [Limnohabitans sp. Hippo4]